MYMITFRGKSLSCIPTNTSPLHLYNTSQALKYAMYMITFRGRSLNCIPSNTSQLHLCDHLSAASLRTPRGH